LPGPHLINTSLGAFKVGEQASSNLLAAFSVDVAEVLQAA